MSEVSWDLARFLISGRSPISAERVPRSRDQKARKPRLLSRFRRDQEGAIAAVSAVSLVVILGFGAFAIDMSYAYSERTLLQATADAAALAAAPELPNKNKARELAFQYVEANMPDNFHGKVLDKKDVVLGHWDPVTETWSPNVGPHNAVQVTTRRSSDNGNHLDLFLAPILGIGSLDMEASAVAYARAPSGWDVALVQDVTGSFDEIDKARDADQALLDCVSNNFTDARMGLTAFTGEATTMTDMLPVGLPENFHNHAQLSDAIYDLDTCTRPDRPPSIPPMPNCTGTNVGIGIEAAIDQLDAYDPADGILGQAIIIVGDGQSNIEGWADDGGLYDPQTYYDESDYYSVCDGDCTNSDLDQMANLAADEAEEKGYDIFVVYYENSTDDVAVEAAAEFFEGLVRGAGQFFRTPNAEELVELVPELCFRFRDLQLVM